MNVTDIAPMQTFLGNSSRNAIIRATRERSNEHTRYRINVVVIRIVTPSATLWGLTRVRECDDIGSYIVYYRLQYH